MAFDLPIEEVATLYPYGLERARWHRDPCDAENLVFMLEQGALALVPVCSVHATA